MSHLYFRRAFFLGGLGLALCLSPVGANDGAASRPTSHPTTSQPASQPTSQPTSQPSNDEKPTVKAPEIISAEDWGSKPQPIPEERRHTPSSLTVHHAGVVWSQGGDPYKKLTSLQSWGQSDKGWPDLPYHYLIAPDGRIFEGRDVNYAPETNTSYETAGHIGINVWGNFEEQRPSQEQLESLVKLLAWLSVEHDIPTDTIKGHKDVAPGQTACPGADLYRYVENGSLKKWADEVVAGGEPKIEMLDAIEGGPTEMIPLD